MVSRRLAAIVVADMAGYSRLMHAAEEATLDRLTRLMSEAIRPRIALHGGRIVKTAGDGFLAEFASAVLAVKCAVEFQEAMRDLTASDPDDGRIAFRVGIHLGDVMVEDDDLYGNGVNIAARLEALSEPGGILVSAAVHENVLGRLPCAFYDLGELRLKNIDRPVRAYRVVVAGNEPPPPLALPDKPSIAVMPFENMSGDPEQQYFADGMVEEIITTLSHARWLFVIARSSSFAYKGKSPDVRRIARELGVRYVLEGSMRRSVDRLRVNAELVDAESGSHLWAERYEAELAHVFAVQDQICAAVVGAILPVVGDAELGRAARRSPASLGAWEAYQRGLWHLRKFNAADNDKAIAFFRQAIAADGSFAWAHLGIAHAYSAEGTTFFTRPLDEALRLFNECVQRAFEIDPSDTVIQSFLAYSLLATGNHASAVQQAERVLERNPSSLQALLAKGRALLFGGHPTEGREMLQSALRLSPNDPGKPIILYEIALSYYDERDYERAVDEARRLKAAYPNHPWANICLAASLAQLGQTIEARDALDNAVAVSPKSFAVYVCQRPPWMRPEEHAHKLDGLHKAGWRPGQ